jgi:hypothetical protein
MSPWINKVAPTALVAALVAWCCWPHWSGARSDDLGQPPESLPKIAHALLSPHIEAASDRDPFALSAASEADSTQIAASPTAEFPQAKLVVKKRPSWEEIAATLSKLSVEATFIHGSRRMALIDGRVYEPGDALRVGIPEASEPCLVARISARNVLIRHRDKALTLTYKDPTSHRGPPGSGHEPGRADPSHGQATGTESGTSSHPNAQSGHEEKPGT